MIPILTSDAMRRADAAAQRTRGVTSLVQLAGTAVGLEAKKLLTGCYGARVAVIVGPGLNGQDGRVAGAWLTSRGARVDLIEVGHEPPTLYGYELVIDAAFGVGCSRDYQAPRVPLGTPVLAVDVPSGVNVDTGDLLGSPLPATVTVALGALKPAHLDGASRDYVGELHFAGLGIVEEFDDGLVEDSDLETFVVRHATDHKWSHALHVFAGSSSMPGAAVLVLRGALVGGASMVRCTSHDSLADLVTFPPEVVLSPEGVVDPRCRAVVAGPGVGPTAPTWLSTHLRDLSCPVVLDADALQRELLDARHDKGHPWILTPHEGEFARLTGAPVPTNRFAAVRRLARETNCVVLLKGPVTVIADPSGTLRAVNVGTSALATAGSGDVLSGLIGATLARGYDPLSAGAYAAHLHARAGARLSPYESASGLPHEVSAVLASLQKHAGAA